MLVSEFEFEASQQISQPLVNLINNGLSLDSYDSKLVNDIKLDFKQVKEQRFCQQFSILSEQLSFEDKHHLLQAKEKGSSSWLTALPLQNQGYTLNKNEFRDSVALRYGWNISDIPRVCACGSQNNVNHALTCSLDGYTHLRHNNLRDLIAELLSDAKCRDVVVEPPLMPVKL